MESGCIYLMDSSGCDGSRGARRVKREELQRLNTQRRRKQVNQRKHPLSSRSASPECDLVCPCPQGRPWREHREERPTAAVTLCRCSLQAAGPGAGVCGCRRSVLRGGEGARAFLLVKGSAAFSCRLTEDVCWIFTRKARTSN